MKLSTLAIGLVIGTSACAATARSPSAYRADTQRLLDTRDAQLTTCYQSALIGDPTLAGTVTVRFVVRKQSGAFTHVTVEPGQSTAPSILRDCVINGVDGLSLTPPDGHEGRATFVYEFKSIPAAPQPPGLTHV